MITNEEMYNFASQIAGIKDSDLEIYKCGGKAKKTKKMEKGGKGNDNGNGNDDGEDREWLNKTLQDGEKAKKDAEAREKAKLNNSSQNPPQKESWLERIGKYRENTVNAAKKKAELLNNKRK